MVTLIAICLLEECTAKVFCLPSVPIYASVRFITELYRFSLNLLLLENPMSLMHICSKLMMKSIHRAHGEQKPVGFKVAKHVNQLFSPRVIKLLLLKRMSNGIELTLINIKKHKSKWLIERCWGPCNMCVYEQMAMYRF